MQFSISGQEMVKPDVIQNDPLPDRFGVRHSLFDIRHSVVSSFPGSGGGNAQVRDEYQGAHAPLSYAYPDD